MGSTGSRIRRRAPKTLRKAKSFQEKLERHDISSKEGEQVNNKDNEYHHKSEDAAIAGKNTMYIKYDSDAEILDFKELFNDNVAEIRKDIESAQEREGHDQGQSEGESIYWNESPTLV